MCFGIAKLGCFSLHKWVFLLLYMSMHAMLKRKICKEKYAKKNKSKKKQTASKMVASMFLGDVRVIRCTSKVIAPIKQLWLYVSVFDFLISQIFIIWDTYVLLQCFTHNTQILCYFSYMCKYNVIWPSQEIHVLIYAH